MATDSSSHTCHGNDPLFNQPSGIRETPNPHCPTSFLQSYSVAVSWASTAGGTQLIEWIQRHAPIQVPEPRKKDPICDPIARELHASRVKISDFDLAFSKREPGFHKLLAKERREKRDKMMKKKLIRFKKINSEVRMSGDELEDMAKMIEFEEEREEEREEDDDDDREEERKADALRVEAMQKWIESNPKSIPGLQKIKEESISLEQDHFVIWARFDKNNCVTKRLNRFSPETMEKEGYFTKLDFEINLINLDDQ
ncbi:hypothetical protein BASA62_000974 [Batrachochytrium salamandrivorans]|nr:hypothetical protein BASA62_000974 [Batrachochytrium salamandrivorans]